MKLIWNLELSIHACKSTENGNQRIHLGCDTMQSAIGMLIAQEHQVDVAEALGRSKSVINRLWKRCRMAGIPDKQHPGPQGLATPVQDHYLDQ